MLVKLKRETNLYGFNGYASDSAVKATICL